MSVISCETEPVPYETNLVYMVDKAYCLRAIHASVKIIT